MFRFALCSLLLSTAILQAQSGNLTIYWVDTEGGGATLIITPSGQSLLADTGNPGPNDRDPKRIYEVTQLAGLKKIDYLLTTHFHSDHVGGTPALAKMIPIGAFLDHGDSIELQNPADAQRFEAYKALAAGHRTTLKPGDKLPLKGIDATVVTANGEVLAKPINGGGANSFCQDAKQKDPDKTENQRSTGFLLSYGKFKFVDLGDLTWDKEMELACPVNKLGEITLLQATHHGFFNDYSGAPALVWALKPQIVVVNNGPRKGLQASAWDTIQKIPGLEGVWQLHLSLATDKEHNTADQMIANPEPTAECKGHWIKATVSRDGKFTLTNSRNDFNKTYTAR
jgi:competence protein ComEC